MEAYYERRAPEYDDWYLGTGLFSDRDRPGWEDELAAVEEVLRGLRPCRTLDVACGTGFVTRHLPGRVVGLDASRAMLREARNRVAGPLVRADGLTLPFRGEAFDRVFSGHFYGHLAVDERERFLAEARHLASELVILDAALRDEVEAEELQRRVLEDGSSHVVYKRYFTDAQLRDEVGGGDVLFEGRWFVMVASTR
jgi:ubiquinone/menaquinone biosynthesis C-methylase UbiE